ncbi:MAG: hypothetical protein GY797_23670 [Deltaproteobacteria bacterium]|nr:hypothetical protein [Deltaproteobacteria bacterium]
MRLLSKIRIRNQLLFMGIIAACCTILSCATNSVVSKTDQLENISEVVNMGNEESNFENCYADQFVYTSEYTPEFLYENAELFQANYTKTYDLRHSRNIDTDSKTFSFSIKNHEKFPVSIKKIKFEGLWAREGSQNCGFPEFQVNEDLVYTDVYIDSNATYSLSKIGGKEGHEFCNISRPVYEDTKRGCKAGYYEKDGICFKHCPGEVNGDKTYFRTGDKRNDNELISECDEKIRTYECQEDGTWEFIKERTRRWKRYCR